MNLFITGGSGFVGTYLLKNKVFLKQFKKIYCLTRSKKVKKNKKVVWIYGNLKSDLKFYFKKSHCLLHLAAHSTNKPYDNLNNCFKWNCLNSIDLINSAYKSGIKKFIITGTYYEYGFAGQIYKTQKISAKSLCLPTSNYALSKAFFLQILFSWSLGKNVSIKYLRFPHVYGDGEFKNRLWSQIKENIVNEIRLDNPDFLTNFININELIKKIINHGNIKNMKKNFFEIINVCGKTMKLTQFVNKEKKRLKSKIKIVKLKNKKNLFKFLIPKKDKVSIKIT